ncbi:gamma-glutamyl hydrolase [Rhinopithecus roxellana]|uniref:folate gamma-glutamyl hydrolase n=2 Tax=Rhinopithecus TaxID=542827 RepID=A0A2K6MVS7_RHIBE|nr:gamma-glutamyl hydrolase [Rhinopithecus roxellana]XP_017748970.1 PREDICTED: gamma-glutamyl hydrolase [Rhinopithecus bieti]
MASPGRLLCVLGLLLCGAASLRLSKPHGDTAKKPIIGILMQKCRNKVMKNYGRYYIAASYVKYLESAGARVVPVRLDLTEKDYETLFKSINGILFPGGSVDLRRSDYAKVAKIFYDLSIQGFHDGDYFPVWGTCLGFEELSLLISGEFLLTITNTVDVAMPLNFTGGQLHSRMFQNFPTELLLSLAVEPLTANFHKWSLSMKNFTMNEKLKKFFNVLTTNTDGEIEFISTMEGYKYPIYGVQWHPEKAPYEWKNLDGISHAPNAVKTAFYLAEFFVNEARKNNHHFQSESEEEKALIYQFSPVYTGNISSFQQCYIFD